MRVALIAQVLAGDTFAQLSAAQFSIGVHQLGNQAYLQLIELGFGGFGLCLAGFDTALDSAEQIKLPGHVQTQVVALDVAALFRSEEHTSELQSRENLVC